MPVWTPLSNALLAPDNKLPRFSLSLCATAKRTLRIAVRILIFAFYDGGATFCYARAFELKEVCHEPVPLLLRTQF